MSEQLLESLHGEGQSVPLPKKVSLTDENMAWIVETYSDDIEGFLIDILGFERLDDWQKWYLKSVQTHGQGAKRVAVASCHSSGKSLLSAAIAIHRLVCFPEARTVVTSATKSQAMNVFSQTLSDLITRSIIADWFEVFRESVTLKGVKSSWIRIMAWSLQTIENFQGVHCKSPMLIADEASGIAPEIFQAWAGNMMHENSCMILLGNPLYRHGELWDAFHRKGDMYETLQVSALDSTFIDPEWIKDIKDEYGEDSNTYRVRVLGEFPTEDIESFIPMELIEGAVKRAVNVSPSDPIVAGLDIGRFRDASVLCVRQGFKVLNIYEFRTTDLMVVSQLVSEKIVMDRIEQVCVDENGIGAGVGDRLRQMHPGMVFPVHLGPIKQLENKEFYNGRAKLWGAAKTWLKSGSIPNDIQLIREGSSLLYDFDPHGRYKLERKQDALKRGVDSPDRFDALAYSLGSFMTGNASRYLSPTIGRGNYDDDDDRYATGIDFTWC